MFWMGFIVGVLIGLIVGLAMGTRGAQVLRQRDKWEAIRTGTFFYDNRIYEVREKHGAQ